MKYNKRKLAAILFASLILITFLWAIKADVDHKKRKEKQLTLGLLQHEPLNYKIELNSFNLSTKTISGVLSLERDWAPLFDDPIPYYTPLVYKDVCEYGAFSIANTMTFFSLKTNTLKFTDKMPETINVNFRALGNPEWYPFDIYVIAGKVKALSYTEKDDKKTYVNKETNSESLSIKNSINGMFMRSPTENEINTFSSILKKDKYIVGEKKYIEVDELKKFSSLKDSFIYIVERPYFLKYMTIILGLIALISAIFIGLKVSIENIAINIMGYVIGVWGIRSILLGETRLFLSYLDYFILSFYLILLTCTLYRIIRGPSLTRVCL